MGRGDRGVPENTPIPVRFERQSRQIEYWREKNRRSNLLNRYGITIEQYEALRIFQHHRCASCGRPESDFKRALHVDHDHKCCPYVRGRTLKACGRCVRGLLCTSCNTKNALADVAHVDWAVVMKEGSRRRPA